ncbi:flavin reductase family protein [Sphingomonas sp. G-3-2-10]|uniref:flavin reductase family protein n=1 Tax=Sphingomonas sp. G-3-2-10 TaxID=2728838 RepID=UPI001469C909|nr:flavin reductase family protein [Sphingomonas sp. G-3-2-10]NML08438.1 flavin reductase family protein [Sphingomonas sp. G-3-2-10]
MTEILSQSTREALRRLAKAVVVITSRHDGTRFAMAATAVNELSMDPPSMLACVNRSASLHPPLDAGAAFCINILHLEQEEVARACGGLMKGEDRFTLGEWGESEDGTPFLASAQANIFCTNEARFSYGTHDVFVGQVSGVTLHGDVNPLVYVDGRYTRALIAA